MSKRALEPDERGDVAYKKRCFAVARTHYDEAIQPSPHEMVFYANKAAALYEEGKYDECISTGEMALEVGSEDKSQVANVMVVIAKAKKSQGKISEALDWLKKASAMYPDPRIDELKADLQIGAVRRPLSNAYPSKLISVLMDIQNHKESCKRTRTLVLSSPIMSFFFEQFMEKFTVAIHSNFCVFFSDPDFETIYIKVWCSLSWLAPFIVQLVIDFSPVVSDFISTADSAPGRSRQNLCDPQLPDIAYNVLPRMRSALKSFSLYVGHLSYDPIHPNVVPFIQRQLSNLQTLRGPIELFLTLSPNPPEPTALKDAMIVIRQYTQSSFPKLFETKRFTATKLEFKFIVPPEGFNYFSNLVNFLKKLTIRMPETQNMTIKMPVLNVRLPAGDLVNALFTVFQQLQTLTLNVGVPPPSRFFQPDDPEHLTKDFTFLTQEIPKMPPQLRVDFHINDFGRFQIPPVGFAVQNWLTNTIVNQNNHIPVCHGNKYFTYQILSL